MNDGLIEAIKVQQATIDRLCEQVRLLTLSVAMLLGEEMGVTQQDPEDSPHRTMDGEGLSFRGERRG